MDISQDVLGEFNKHVDTFMQGLAKADERFKGIAVSIISVSPSIDKETPATYSMITNTPPEKHVELFRFIETIARQNRENLEIGADEPLDIAPWEEK
ncbi:MAG: hypothetical protein ACR2PH_01640 [Desulfobulbia bacterium]